MDILQICGGQPLQGHITVSGAKNSALKLMAAALLTDEPLILSHMPILDDTRFMAQLLGELGVSIEWRPNQKLCVLHAGILVSSTAPYELVRKMRATFNVLGPLLAREGQANVSLPGGCAIGARPVDMHLSALSAMGAEIRIENGYVYGRAVSGLSGARINFPRVSVGATEQAMLAATLARGQTVLNNAAREPEIIDLATCLTKMGARISGAGSGCVTIEGVERLHGASHKIMPDRIEAGAYAMAAAASKGDVVLKGVEAGQMEAVLHPLRQAGVDIYECGHGQIRVCYSGSLRAVDIRTAPYPGFPTDLQAPFMALMTLAEGESRITETIFENRFRHAPELQRLGARIELEGNCARVRGGSSLHGAEVIATDLRASISLVVAALAARRGRTIIQRLEHLDRGFEQLEEKLSSCGADLKRLQRPVQPRESVSRGISAA